MILLFQPNDLEQLNAERPRFFSILDSVLTQIENHYPNFEGIDANNPDLFRINRFKVIQGNVEVGLQNFSDFCRKNYSTMNNLIVIYAILRK